MASVLGRPVPKVSGLYSRHDITGQSTADKRIVPYGILAISIRLHSLSLTALYDEIHLYRVGTHRHNLNNDPMTSNQHHQYLTTQQDCNGREQAQDSAGGVCCCCYSNISGMWDQRKSLLTVIGGFTLTKRPVCLFRMGTGIC